MMEFCKTTVASAALAVAVSVSGGLFATTADAATVVFSQPDWVDEESNAINVDYRIEIDDSPVDGYRFTVSIDPDSVQVGDILKIGISTKLDLKAEDFKYVSSVATSSISDVCLNAKDCGGSGGGFTGGLFNGLDDFAAVLLIGKTGGAGGLVTNLVFDLFPTSAPALDETIFTAMAIRAQSVGDAPDGGDRAGSLKIYNNKPTTPPPPPPPIVPLPAAGLLLAGALGGLGLMRRLRRAA